VLTDKGVDIGPAIAERMRERGLADAHVVAEPSGSAPYVDGKIHLVDADRGRSFGLVLGEVTLLVVGGLTDLVGGMLWGIGAGSSDPGGPGLAAGGAGTLAVGLALTGLGIYLAAHPSRYMDATVAADLNVARGPRTTPLQIEDKASVWHNTDEPQAGGAKLLDGVVNGICTETQ